MKKLSLKSLIFWFNDKETLFSYFKRQQIGKGHKRRLFWDNGAKVLLVAHIDTVHPPKIKQITKETIYATGLDDRLGCALGHHIMQLINVDLLICDYEESGATTAEFHQLKKYNFIIELDRNGTDFVDYYGLASNTFVDDFSNFTERKLGLGSYSDICSMKTKIGRINVGVGYYKDHSKDSYAVRKQIDKALIDVVGFIKKYGNTSYQKGVKTEFTYSFGWPTYSRDKLLGDELRAKDNNCCDYGEDTWVCVHCNTTIERDSFLPPICCGDDMQLYKECYRL